MFSRLFNALRALAGGAAVAANPVKTIAAVILSMIIPYLLYAFLGGAAFVLILAGIIAGVWWLARRNKK
jgi:hypothetical protein